MAQNRMYRVGARPSLAQSLNEAREAQQVMRINDAKLQMQERAMMDDERERMMQKRLASTLQGVKLETPADMMKASQALIASGVPSAIQQGVKLREAAIEMGAEARRVKAQEAEQKFLQNLTTDGIQSGQMNKMQALVASNSKDPIVAAAGQAALDELEKTEEQKEETRKVTVPGFEPVEEVQPSADSAKSLRDITAAKNNIKKLTNTLKGLVKEKGFQPTYPVPFTEKTAGSPEGKRLEDLNKSVQLQMKNLNELGAIQAPDVPFLQNYPDPTSIIDINSLDNDIGEWERQVEAFEQRLEDQVDAIANASGYRRKGQEKQEPTQASPYQGMTVEQLTPAQKEYLRSQGLL